MAGARNSGGAKWTGGRRRRTSIQIAGAREAGSIAASLGRELQSGRKAVRLTQADVGRRLGISHSRYGDLERGHGAGAPIGLWIAAGLTVGRPLAITVSRALSPQPRDGGHLSAQEHVLARARVSGITGTFELPTRRAPNASYIDVGLRDDRHRTLSVIEIWNRFDDLGAGSRSFSAKLVDAAALAVAVGGDQRPYRVAGCWVLRATAANRSLVARYPAILAAQFPGSSRAWARTLTTGAEPPAEPGITWVDLAGTRVFELRILHAPGRTAGSPGHPVAPAGAIPAPTALTRARRSR